MKRVDVLQLALAALRRSSELTDVARSWSRAEWAKQCSDAIAAIEQELGYPPDVDISKDFSPADVHSIRRSWAVSPPPKIFAIGRCSVGI